MTDLTRSLALATGLIEYAVARKLPEPTYVTSSRGYAAVSFAVAGRDEVEQWAWWREVEMTERPSLPNLIYRADFIYEGVAVEVYAVVPSPEPRHLDLAGSTAAACAAIKAAAS
jgi:hypothetical protein